MNISSNAQVVERWQAPDGTWWFLVEYKKSDVINVITTILQRTQASYPQVNIQQVSQILDRIFSRINKAMVVND